MLKFVLDVVMLVAILEALLQNEAPDLPQVGFVALGMGAANFVCSLFLGQLLGLLVIAPIVVIDGLILMYFCGLTIKYAAIALGALFVYNVVFYALTTLVFA